MKGSTWLKCSNMCVAHILANPPIYYVELNMNNCQWKLEGKYTWQPEWRDCKTTNIKENPLIMARSMLGGNETILGMVCSSKVQQLKLCGTFVQFIKERKIKHL